MPSSTKCNHVRAVCVYCHMPLSSRFRCTSNKLHAQQVTARMLQVAWQRLQICKCAPVALVFSAGETPCYQEPPQSKRVETLVGGRALACPASPHTKISQNASAQHPSRKQEPATVQTVAAPKQLIPRWAHTSGTQHYCTVAKVLSNSMHKTIPHHS